MTFKELHKILDDESRKLSKEELAQIIYELKQDCFNEVYKRENISRADERYYLGEANAFQICLDLLEHLEV